MAGVWNFWRVYEPSGGFMLALDDPIDPNMTRLEQSL